MDTNVSTLSGRQRRLDVRLREVTVAGWQTVLVIEIVIGHDRLAPDDGGDPFRRLTWTILKERGKGVTLPQILRLPKQVKQRVAIAVKSAKMPLN